MTKDLIEKVEKEEIKLSDDQKLNILNEWNNRPQNPPSLQELIKLVWNDEFASQSKQGLAVRKYLAEKALDFAKPYVYKPKEEVELTKEQEEYLSNNCPNSTPLEMGKVLFNNPKLTNLSIEIRGIKKYLSTLPDKVLFNNANADIPDEEFKAPNTLDRVVARVNKYRTEQLDYKKINAIEKKNMNSLMAYLHAYRLVSLINTYDKISDRELFESSFIRCCFDKNDLTEEEVDQYIIYSAEVVISKNISKRIEDFSAKLDENLSSNGNLGMALVEAITSLRNEYNQCVKRQTDLLKSLQGTRSERMANKLQDTASIHNLVEMWKYEENRKKLIEVANKRNDKLKEEISKLTSAESFIASVLGLSDNEVING